MVMWVAVHRATIPYALRAMGFGRRLISQSIIPRSGYGIVIQGIITKPIPRRVYGIAGFGASSGLVLTEMSVVTFQIPSTLR